jgi:alpha-N-arabinofuranosidase
VFLVNRSQNEAITTTISWQGASPGAVTTMYQLSGSDPKAINTFAQPELIVPQQLAGPTIRNGQLTLQLPPLSFTVLATNSYREA